MRVLKLDPMLLLALLVGLGVVMTMKLASLDGNVTPAEEKAQKLKSDIYSSSAHSFTLQSEAQKTYLDDKRISRLSINSW